MNQTTIINKINDLRYDGLKQAYLRQIEDISYNKLSFEERLYNLLESQEIFLHNKKISMNWKLTDLGHTYHLEVRNSILFYRSDALADTVDITLITTREACNKIFAGVEKFADLVSKGRWMEIQTN